MFLLQRHVVSFAFRNNSIKPYRPLPALLTRLPYLSTLVREMFGLGAASPSTSVPSFTTWPKPPHRVVSGMGGNAVAASPSLKPRSSSSPLFPPKFESLCSPSFFSPLSGLLPPPANVVVSPSDVLTSSDQRRCFLCHSVSS